VPFYSLREKIFSWQDTLHYPSSEGLPAGISFPSEFWSRVNDIQRFTREDGFERAITVWWADGEFVVADYVRGDKKKVTIPKQEIQVEYKKITSSRYEKVVTLAGKVYSRRSVQPTEVARKKSIQVKFLFNMHTHPPHENEYAMFSATDIRSFLSSRSALTGLITDKLWLLFKTNAVDAIKNIPIDRSGEIKLEELTMDFGFKVYAGELGRAVVVQDPEIPTSRQ